MSWVYEAVASALFLGLYDVFKKQSVNGNAVIPTLFLAVCCGAAIWAPWVVWSAIGGADGAPIELLRVDDLDLADHGRLVLKSAIVAVSWVLSYFALKHLPVSVAGSIRATGPFWTLAGAVVLFAERPSPLQWLGIGVTLASFVALSFAGRREGLLFHRDRWVFFMVGATLAGTASGLYDKHLMGTLGYRASTVQAWFSIYLVVVLLPVVVGWWRRWWPRFARRATTHGTLPWPSTSSGSRTLRQGSSSPTLRRSSRLRPVGHDGRVGHLFQPSCERIGWS